MKATLAPSLLLVAALLRPSPARAASPAEHMLAGAQAFREERYPEALVEFRAAEKTGPGDPGATWYVAAALVKLNRAEDALTAFARAEDLAPGERDGLFDYYHALACYDARLYTCADRLLAALGADPAPKIAAQARQIRRDLAPLLSAAPAPAAIDWYHTQAQAALVAGRATLAAAYFDEAAALAALRSDGHRRGEAQAGAARARRAAAATERRRP
jgi:tetratricopeptide (TPR) repeat protein